MSDPTTRAPATEDDHLDRIVQALGHPIRRLILRALARRRGSAKTISKELGLPLGTVSYHLNEVLFQECRVVKQVRRVERRGAIERVCAIDSHVFRGVVPWAEIPEPIRARLRGIAMTEFLDLLMTVIADPSPGKLDDSRLEWASVEVDRHGLCEILDALNQASEARHTAVANSLKRQKGSEGTALFSVVVASAAFKAVGDP